jgi:hypothetical protein
MVIFELSAAVEPSTETHLETMIAAHKNKPIKDRVFFIRPSSELQSLEESMLYIQVDEVSTPKALQKKIHDSQNKKPPVKKDVPKI